MRIHNDHDTDLVVHHQLPSARLIAISRVMSHCPYHQSIPSWSFPALAASGAADTK
jgi:hypothetical protein